MTMLQQFSSVAEACENSDVFVLAIRPSETFVAPRWTQLVDYALNDIRREIAGVVAMLSVNNIGTICVRSYDREIPVILTYGGSLTPVQALSINYLLRGGRERVPRTFLHSLDVACDRPDTQRGAIYFGGYDQQQLYWLCGEPPLLCVYDHWRVPFVWSGDIVTDLL